jgi:hypothetical protein
MGFPAAAAENACWWASMKMVLDTGGDHGDTAPAELKNATSALDILAIEGIYPRYHMYPPFPSPTPESWGAAALVEAFKAKGPMVACGRFAEGDHSTSEFGGQVQHAIVVYGVLHGGAVRYNDPWQPKKSLMLLDDFNSKLHVGRSRLIGASRFIRAQDMHTVPPTPSAK